VQRLSVYNEGPGAKLKARGEIQGQTAWLDWSWKLLCRYSYHWTVNETTKLAQIFIVWHFEPLSLAN